MSELTTVARFSVQLTEATQTETLDNILISGDANAYEIVVDVYRNGQPVYLDGASVLGIGILPGNISVFTQGTASGNVARFVMTDEFHAKKGTLYVLMTVVLDGVQVTLFRGVCQVLKSAMQTSVLSNETFPVIDLIEAAKNEQERILNEEQRKIGYKEFAYIAEQAALVLSANTIGVVDNGNGHIELKGGLQYNAYEQDVRIRSLIAQVTEMIEATDNHLADVESQVSDNKAQLGNKFDVHQGEQNAGKLVTVDADGDLTLTSMTLDNTLLAKTYPVGITVAFENDSNPAELYGGVWEEITDKVLVGSGEMFEVGTIGGNPKVMILPDQVPNGGDA